MQKAFNKLEWRTTTIWQRDAQRDETWQCRQWVDDPNKQRAEMVQYEYYANLEKRIKQMSKNNNWIEWNAEKLCVRERRVFVWHRFHRLFTCFHLAILIKFFSLRLFGFFCFSVFLFFLVFEFEIWSSKRNKRKKCKISWNLIQWFYRNGNVTLYTIYSPNMSPIVDVKKVRKITSKAFEVTFFFSYFILFLPPNESDSIESQTKSNQSNEKSTWSEKIAKSLKNQLKSITKLCASD